MRATGAVTAVLFAVGTSCVNPAPEPCTECGGKCVDTNLDPANCGACGKQCGAGQLCTNGACVMQACVSGTTSCSGKCVDTTIDPANCGGCGTMCMTGEFCRSSMCTPQCPAPYAVCGASCVDRQVDRANCGACGTTCATGERCQSGACVQSCGPGLATCAVGDAGAATCIDLQTDARHCGACGRQCVTGANATGVACTAGRCVSACEAGLADDDGNDANGCESVAKRGLLLWLKADTLSGLPSDAGVDTWPDSSGNGVSVVKNGTSGPKVIQAGRNGLPVVSFDGTNTPLVTPSLQLFDRPDGELTVVAVFRPTLDAQRFLLMLRSTNCVDNFELGTRTGGQALNLGLHSGCSNAVSSALDLTEEWMVGTVMVRRAGATPSNVQLFRNGLGLDVRQDMAGYTPAGQYTTVQRPLLIGARDSVGLGLDGFFKGEVGELLVFKRALSGPERQTLERQLMTKWGLTPRPRVLSGEVELLETTQPLQLQAQKRDGGTMTARLSSSGGFSFPWEPAASAGLTVAAQPTSASCRVLDGGAVTPAGDLEGALVTCGYARQVTRGPNAAAETQTTSATFEDVPGMAPLRFTTVRPDLNVLVSVSLPYLAGHGTTGVFGEGVLGVEVDGVVVAETTNGSGYWGQGGPTSVSTVVRVPAGQHEVKGVWRVGSLLGMLVPARHARMADADWQTNEVGALSAVVLESYAGFRGVTKVESTAQLIHQSAMYTPMLSALPVNLTAPAKVLAGVMVPDGYSPAPNAKTLYRVEWDGAMKAAGSFVYEGAKRPAAMWSLEAADAGMHTLGAELAAETVMNPSLVGGSGQARRSMAMVFEPGLPSGSATRANGVTAGMGVVAPLLNTSVTLTKATQVVAVLTVESAYTVGNGPIADVFLQVGTNRLGAFFQSQNSSYSQPVTLIWVGTLPAGAQAVSASVIGRNGTGVTTGMASLHVLALEP